MDMTMSIASLGMAMSASRFMLDMNFALMDKALDVAQLQGEAVQGMMETAAPALHVLDVYA